MIVNLHLFLLFLLLLLVLLLFLLLLLLSARWCLSGSLILVVGGLGVSGLLAWPLPEPLGELGWGEGVRPRGYVAFS